jgi:hypothetical protein
MLYLFGKGVHFRRAKGRLLLLEKALRGAVAPPVVRHSFVGAERTSYSWSANSRMTALPGVSSRLISAAVGSCCGAAVGCAVCIPSGRKA